MDSRVQVVGMQYEFDDVRVEPLSHRLFKAGREVAVEPKVYALLLEFLRRPGEVITHDELLDAVWQHHHVTPAALARVVSRLRRHLDDPPESPRCLQTVHTLGYRFIAPVRESPAGAIVAARDPAAPLHPAPADAGPAFESASAEPPRAHTAWRARRVALAFATTLVLAAASACAWIWRSGGAPMPAPFSIAVLPLAAPSADAELRATALGFTDGIVDALSRMPGARVGGRGSALAIGAAGASSPAQAAQTLGVDNVVFGQIVARDAELGVRLELWRRGSAAPRMLLDERVPRAQLFRALSRATAGIQASLRAGAAPPPAATPLTAREWYLLGRAQWQEQTPSALLRALDYFQRAADADPAYAPAWCGLADTYSRLDPDAVSETRTADKARAALAQAKLLAPGSADVFVSEGLFYENQPGHRGDALLAFKRALELNPRHPLALLRYANELRYAGRVREAIEWHARALESDPLSVRLHNELAADYAESGDQARADEQIARVLALDPGNADVHGRMAVQREIKGELAAAAREFGEKIDRKPAPELYEYIDLARVYLRAGAVDLAEQTLSASPQPDTIDWLYEFAGVRMAQGRYAEALDLFAARCPPPALVEKCSDQQARLLALVGRRDDALALYDALYADAVRNGEQPTAFWHEEFYWHQFAAWLALLPPASIERSRGLAWFASEIQRLDDNGVRCASVDYQRASQAALSGDADAARRHLDAAIASGWLDASALDRDLEWQPYRHADWMAAARTRIASLVAAERSKLPGSIGRLTAR